MRPRAEGMVRAQADVVYGNALWQLCWIDPHHAQGPALLFGSGDSLGGCVWAESGEGGWDGDVRRM